MGTTSDNESSSSSKLPTSNVCTKKSKISNFFKDVFPTQLAKQFSLDTTDSVLLLLFASLGMITRIFRIQYPQYVVFDEVHFGSFINSYINRNYFFDIHPPLAKLILAGVAKYVGYNSEYKFNALYSSDTKYPTMMYVSLRMIPAFFGGFCVPLTYLIMRVLHSSHFAASIASILVCSDIMLIVESRHILIDSILHFFSLLAIFSIFLYEQYYNIYSLIFESVCLGLVISCKFTSGGIILLAVFRQMRHRKGFIPRVFVMGLIILGIHILIYWIHLSVIIYLPFSSDQAVPKSINCTLVDSTSPDWEARYNGPSKFIQIFDLIKLQLRINSRINKGHPYASPWWSWPLCLRNWVLFWVKGKSRIICMGNVLLWYPVFFGVIYALIFDHNFDNDTGALLMGYLFSYLPFALVGRECFLYHYAIPLLFGILLLVRLIETKLAPIVRGFMYTLIAALSVGGFFLWNPLAYGKDVDDFEFMIWNQKWAL